MTTASPSRLGDALREVLARETPPADALPWRRALAEAAREQLAARGLPGARDEDWLYTDTRPLAAPAVRRAGPARRAGPLPADRLHLSPFAPEVVLVNGRLDSAASRLDTSLARLGGAVLGRLALDDQAGAGRASAARGTPWAHLNAARFVDGISLRLPPGHRGAGPIVVVHTTAPDGAGRSASTYPRLCIEAGAGAEARVVEIFLADDEGPELVDAVTEIELGEGARLAHLRLQLQLGAARHIGTTAARVARGAHYGLVDVTFGGATHRHDVHVDLVDEGADLTLAGLYVLRDKDHADTHVVVDHRRPGGTSQQVVKGILDDRSRGAFTGRVLVHKDAQQTSGRQAHHALLLDEGARVDTRPQLEIHADDVQCAHGATVGQLDEEAIGYMQARAIGREQARRLLIRAFAHEVIKTIGHEALQKDLHRLLEARLEGAHVGADPAAGR